MYDTNEVELIFFENKSEFLYNNVQRLFDRVNSLIRLIETVNTLFENFKVQGETRTIFYCETFKSKQYFMHNFAEM